MTYVVDNNGTYGLTKGQFSATNDKGSTSKKGVPNLYEPIDLCMMAIQLGATFVARSFSGDKGQLVPLLKAALKHDGFAFLDVISPCVAFNNHEGSTKSYAHVREHSDVLTTADLIPLAQETVVEYDEGTSEDVAMPDGSTLRLHKLHADYDPHDRAGAMEAIMRLAQEGEIVTGLLYLDREPTDCHEILGTVEAPLNSLGDADLTPSAEQLDAINAGFR
jgi:2-oxoglutarate ferredoxin oxidoreductase subunit beta